MDVRARKYKSIYDAIDAYNFRGALKLCAKRDIESAPLTKALKAYCSVKLGAEAEALELCDDVMRTIPTDEDVCSTVSSVLHLCGETRRAAKMFEAAVAASPGSVPLQRDLFFCYDLLGESKAQQTTAMRLWKDSGSAEYVFWAALAMNKQVATAATPTPAPVLNLAEMMMRKPIDAGAIRHGEALGLLFHTMARQGKAADALAAFRGALHYITTPEEEAKIAADDDIPAANPDVEADHNLKKTPALLQPGDALRLEIYLAIQAKLWPEVHELFVKALNEVDAEDWSFYCGLIASMFLAGSTAASRHHTVATVRASLQRLQASECSKRPASIVRGPFLAEMLLDCALLQRDCSGASESSPAAREEVAALVTNILEYIRRVGASSAVFYDLQRVLRPFIVPAKWSAAAIPTAAADVDGSALLAQYGLTYPVVDVFFAPLPANGLQHGFSFVVAESHRIALYAGLAEFVSESNRPSATLSTELGAIVKTAAGGAGGPSANGPADVSLTPEQEKLLQAARDRMQLFVTVLQIQSLLGVTCTDTCRTEESALEYVGKLVENWRRSLITRTGYERNIGVLPGDDFVLLACQTLREIAAARLSRDAGSLVPVYQLVLEALLLLDAGLKESKHNSQFRLAQLQFYQWLGPVVAATDAYNGLRPKHMQIDTLTYLTLPMLSRCGGHNVAKQLAEDCHVFHRNSVRDIGDATRQAYIRASYSKVLEFAAFDAKLKASLQLAQLKSFAAAQMLPFRQFSELQLYLRRIVTGEIPQLALDFSDAELSALIDLSDFNACVLLRAAMPGREFRSSSLPRSRCVTDVRTRQQYLRMLYWAAEGNADSLRDAIPVLQGLLIRSGDLPTGDSAAASASDAVVSLEPWNLSLGPLQPRIPVKHDIYATVLATFDACQFFFRAVTTTAPAAAASSWEQAGHLFASIARRTAALIGTVSEAPFLSGPPGAATAKGGVDVLVSPQFLAEASLLISELLSVLVVTVFACCKSMPKRKSAKKEGKGKGTAASASPEDAGMDAAFAALKECVTVVSKGASGLLGVLATHDKMKSSGGSAVLSMFYSTEGAASAFARSEEGAARAVAVFNGLQESYSQSFAQLHAMLSDRVAMAKAAKT